MLLSGLAPAAFGAANRYASPGGSGSACTQIAPCAIDVAINGANSGDDITLLGGVPPAAPYSHSGSSELGQVCTPGCTPITNITIHGAPGARPVINMSNTGGDGFFLGSGSTLRDVVVESTSVNNNAVSAFGGTVERVSAHQSVADSRACAFGNGSVIRDTVCWYTGQAGVFNAAAAAFSQVGGDAPALRNVTAIAPNAYGILAVGQSLHSLALSVTNTIAEGGVVDVKSDQNGGATTHQVILDHSNYATESEFTSGDVTNPGSGTNTTTPPDFVDAANGDFHEKPSSTGTIDLGTSSGLLGGELDLDGLARSQGAAPDIGAFELPQAPAGPSDGQPSANPGGTTASPASPSKKCKKKKGRAAAAKKCRKKK